jgi:transcriptional regulator with XRE-family HTH domain
MSKHRILGALRFKMKTKGMSYSKLASLLNVSEVSVKRYFSEERMSLDVLDKICVALESSLEEMLAEFAEGSGEQQTSFTIVQEEALASHDLLFAVFYLVAGGWSFEAIVSSHSISGAELTRSLRALEKLGLVDFSTNARLRARLPIETHWSPEGPLFTKFKARAVEEFFNSDFTQKNEFLKLGIGPLLPDSANVVRRKMIELQDEIQRLSQLDQKHIADITSVDGYWFVTALRPMSFSVIRDAVMKKP